jgi:hypothetical protein
MAAGHARDVQRAQDVAERGRRSAFPPTAQSIGHEEHVREQHALARQARRL